MEYYPVTYKLCDGGVITVHIRDTCGQERYDAIWVKYYKIADGILLVFDISDKKSFIKIKEYYVEKIRENCKKEIPIILLGNKTDLNSKREVSQEEAINLSINEEFIYKETSCLKNENVADAFETIIEMWNIQNKKKNKTPIKRSKSKENMDNNEDSCRTGSFALSQRNYSLKNNKSINNDEESQKIILKKKNKKKKKNFC